jgi:hypothetical protein
MGNNAPAAGHIRPSRSPRLGGLRAETMHGGRGSWDFEAAEMCGAGRCGVGIMVPPVEDEGDRVGGGGEEEGG